MPTFSPARIVRAIAFTGCALVPRVHAQAALQPRVAPPVLLAARDDAVPDSANAVERMRAGFAPAARTSGAVSIDGRDADAVWMNAMRITHFRVTDPTEDGDPSFRTEARIAYDDRNLYVFVRAFDPRPDSVVGMLGRRDIRTPSDWIRVMVDSYHDKRTGWAFMLNPASVQRDLAITNDGDEDITWDGVWDGRAQIDSLGWTAEFRIPFNQLRFPPSAQHTFGVMIMRAVQRKGETSSWPLLRRSKVGLASQFGSIDGIDNVPTPRRLEVLPYLVERNVSRAATAGGFNRVQQHAAGLDLKYGLGSNLTLDATVNPDFGQVEADPAVLNLTAFEQFFTERRPFFIEGSGIFRFDTDCNDGDCTGLFYSRRIGRSPTLAGSFGDATSPQFTTILGASKLTGRTSHGTSVGLLSALTRRETGTEGRTIEPQTNFVVGRVMQDLRGGNSQVGLIGTAVLRDLDQWTTDVMRRNAFTAGL
ncbi:MAG: carbohydrate binding family 9 domain-containing protein, partial [Gemmatimonadaceae bacterium]|nr:carbohydrate binding family 9 domain-containing protein [Gemmatimonadaceae bacterium]